MRPINKHATLGLPTPGILIIATKRIMSSRLRTGRLSLSVVAYTMVLPMDIGERSPDAAHNCTYETSVTRDQSTGTGGQIHGKLFNDLLRTVAVMAALLMENPDRIRGAEYLCLLCLGTDKCIADGNSLVHS